MENHGKPMAERWLEDATEEEISDSDLLRQTFMIYGPLFAGVWLALCCVKKRHPKAFNLRSWVPKLQCDLSKQKFGFLSWSWRVYGASDDEILTQCGMDALCLLRALCFAEKLALVGIFISFFLLPIYKTAPDAPDTEQITDRAVEMTIANVPEGSDRLYATVVAAYIQYIVAWIILWKDFDWFTRNRLKFLSQRKPRNYSVYVSGIPRAYQSNQALANYFQRLASSHRTLAVYQASVALKIPQLEHRVSTRETVNQKLEHALALQAIKGVTPTHRTRLCGGEIVNSIDAYQQQLQELNEEVSSEITRIDQDDETQNEAVEASSRAMESEDEETQSDAVEANSRVKESFHSCHEAGDIELGEGATGTSLDGHARPDRQVSLLANEEHEKSIESSPTGDDKEGDEKLEKEPSGEHLPFPSINDDHVDRAESPLAKQENDNPLGPLSGKVMNDVMSNATKGMPFVGRDQDGVPRDAGFVSFTSLTDTNAIIQVTHSVAPYQMVVHEAPNHEGILWRNVGLDQKAIQFGTLVAFALSAVICLFYTIPVSFALSLTSVESLTEMFPSLEYWLEKFPWLEPLLDQIAPLLLSLFDSILPMVLKLVASFEGHVGESHLEASLFLKLSAFKIIQTFFVANAANSVTTGVQLVIENPTEIVQFLATQLPPQSSFYIQLVMVELVFGTLFECLRIFPLLQVWIRETFGPNLTEKERSRVWRGLRPLSDPRNFFHARFFATVILYLMVGFVYTTIAPITVYVLAFCFLVMGSSNRNQFFYIYSTNPDSGGMLWLRFVHIALICMLTAQLTLAAYLGLKMAPVAAGLMVPLIVFQILFHIWIQNRHFRVASRLPTEDSLRMDEDGPTDFTFLKDMYKQSALKVKELEPDCPPLDGSEDEEDGPATTRKEPQDASGNESDSSSQPSTSIAVGANSTS